MPARSIAQQRFMGLVHAVQTGRKSMSEVSPEVAEKAKTMTPRDVTEFSSTKHKDLPAKVSEAEDAGSRKVASLRPVALLQLVISPWFGTSKSAALEAVVKSTEKQLRAAQKSREQSLKAHASRLAEQLQAAQAKSQAAEQEKMMAQGQAAQAALPANAPVPPPSQPPYGRMITGMQPEQTDRKS